MNRLLLDIPEENRHIPLMDIQFLSTKREKNIITISGTIYFNGSPVDTFDKEFNEVWVLVDGIKRSHMQNFKVSALDPGPVSGPYYNFTATSLVHYLF